MVPTVAPMPVMMSTTMMVRTIAFCFVFQLETACRGSRRLRFVTVVSPEVRVAVPVAIFRFLFRFESAGIRGHRL